MEKSLSGLKEVFKKVTRRNHLVMDYKTMTYPGLNLRSRFSQKTRMLKPYEMNYYSAKRELLALLHRLEKFSHVLS